MGLGADPEDLGETATGGERKRIEGKLDFQGNGPGGAAGGVPSLQLRRGLGKAGEDLSRTRMEARVIMPEKRERSFFVAGGDDGGRS